VAADEKIHFIGNLFVDGIRFTVEPMEILLRTGEKTDFTLRINRPAKTDLYINITTDIPHSVIMPEVHFAAGASEVTVTIEGGEPGKGNLYISPHEFNEIITPIEVIDRKE
jgi:Na+-transporting methylmalonyl-CoA/oxaloacetate decarboxylase beta subunit